MKPLVSVIIPTYNRAITIKRAIDSVLRQSYKNIELIIVDDCSTDNTVNIVNSYEDERIRMICLSHNSGANIARNKGICVANGEYIAFQDSDDEWLRDKLETQLKYMIDTGKKVCYCPYTLYENNAKRIIPTYAERTDIYESKVEDILRKKNVISTQTLIIHKEVIETVGMFESTLRRLQDYEFVIRICQKFEVAYVNRPLVNVFRVRDCISNSRVFLADAYKKIIYKHINFIDFNCLVRSYLFNCDWYDAKNIYWEYINEILKFAQTLEKSEIIAQCNQVKDCMISWHKFFNKNIIGKDFIIYGAGYYGKEVYCTLKKMGVMPKCFLVTNMEGEEKIDGIPIVELSNKIDTQLPVIIAVSKEKQKELESILISNSILNFYIYPFC